MGEQRLAMQMPWAGSGLGQGGGAWDSPSKGVHVGQGGAGVLEGSPLGTGVGVEPRTSGRWVGVMG